MKKPKKIVDFSTNFRSTAENVTEILRKFFKFLTDFVEVFKILMLCMSHFLEVMKKFWKRFFKILMTFVEKCGELLYKFLSILIEILYFFYFSFWKNLEELWGKICNLSIWISIPEKSIDTYQFLKVSISIDTFPITITNMNTLVRVFVSKKGVEIKIFGVPNVDIISQDSFMYNMFQRNVSESWKK